MFFIINNIYYYYQKIQHFSPQKTQDQESQPLIQKEQKQHKPNTLFYLTLSSILINLCCFICSLIYYAYTKSNDLIAFTFGKAENGSVYLGLFITFIVLTLISIAILVLTIYNKIILTKANQLIAGISLNSVSIALAITLICAYFIKPQQIVYSYYPNDQGFKFNYYTVQKYNTNVKVDYLNGTIENITNDRQDYMHSVSINSTDKCLVTVKYSDKHYIQNIQLSNQQVKQHQFYVSSDTIDNKQLQQQTQNISMENNFYLYIPNKQQNKQQALINYYNTLLYSNTHFLYVSNCSSTHHEIINGDNFYFINLNNYTYDDLYEYLDTEIPKQKGIKYLVVDQIIMSAGPSGINENISEIFLSIIDRYPTQQISGVLQPSDGCLSTFKLGNTYIISVGRGIQEADVNNSKVMGDRMWNQDQLQGPLNQLQDSTLYSLHYYSNLQQQYLQINVDENQQVQMSINQLQTQEQVTNLSEETKQVYEWGPIMTPYEQGANISWYTKEASFGSLCINNILYYSDSNMFNTKTHNGCIANITNKPVTKYHSVYVPLLQFNFTLNGKDMQFDNTKRTQHKFLATTDLHEDFFVGRKTEATASQFDFHVYTGDTSYLSSNIEYDACYNSFQSPTELYLPVEGNHDTFAYHYQKLAHMLDKNFEVRGVHRRDESYYQNIQGLNFFTLFIFNGSKITLESETLINQTLEYLEQQLIQHQNDGLKFILTHRPIYSTGGFGSNQNFTQRVETIIKNFNDQQQNSSNRIVCVISGHDHVFNSFYNQDLQIWSLDVASGGGLLDTVYQKHYMDGRQWTSNQLHGDLSEQYGNEGKAYGYNWHVDSIRKFTQTEIEVDEINKKITYTVRNIITMEVLYVYTQNY